MKRSILLYCVMIAFFQCGNQAVTEAADPGIATVFYPEISGMAASRICLSPLEKMDLIAITAVGDIMTGSHVTRFLDAHGNGYPFDSTRHVLNKRGMTIGNLEAPYGTSGVKFDKKFNFMIHPRYSSGLKSAGLDVVTLANNHMMDYGEEALRSTLQTLDSLGIAYSGAGVDLDHARMPSVLEQDSVTVAFLGCSMTYPAEFWAGKERAGTWYPTERSLVDQIRLCEEIADYTVVSFHWGQERRDSPKDYQTHFAHLAIDTGADLVLGHHPHVLQGVEIYKNRLIIYSLGNFAFGSYSYSARESIILRVYLWGRGLLFARVFPISVNNHEVLFQPRLLRGTRADSLIDYLNQISMPLNGGVGPVSDNGIILPMSVADSVQYAKE